jgi:hypothetical protein
MPPHTRPAPHSAAIVFWLNLFYVHFHTRSVASFRRFLGLEPKEVNYVWEKYLEDGDNFKQKHFMWALFFLRRYETEEAVGCRLNISTNSYRCHIWQVLHHLHSTMDEIDLKDRFNQLPPSGIFFGCLFALDGTECPIQRPHNYRTQRIYYSGRLKV